eukprot:5045889-Pleurochrysis_carterae.AAC.2
MRRWTTDALLAVRTERIKCLGMMAIASPAYKFRAATTNAPRCFPVSSAICTPESVTPCAWSQSTKFFMAICQGKSGKKPPAAFTNVSMQKQQGPCRTRGRGRHTSTKGRVSPSCLDSLVLPSALRYATTLACNGVDAPCVFKLRQKPTVSNVAV